MSIVAWFKRFKRRRLDEEDLREEIRAHLAIATQDRIADGADPETARHEAVKDFGNVLLTTEAARKVWTPWWLELVLDVGSDVRYAIRTLTKHPAFALTVVAVLTLGIGANAAVFTMLKGIALSPIAGVDGSARLTVIYGETSGGRQVQVSYPDYQLLRDHDRAFTALFGSALAKVNLGRGRAARQIWAELVTGNYFASLGVPAQPAARSCRPTKPPPAVIRRGDQPWALAARLRGRSGHRRKDGRDQQQPADGCRCCRSGVSRNDCGLRRRGVRPDHAGAAARLQFWKPAGHAVSHPVRPSRRVLLSPGVPAAGHDDWQRRRRDRGALGHTLARPLANGYGPASCGSSRSGRCQAARRASCSRR